MPFQLIREEYIAEINSRAKLYRHDTTGAELLSIENTDENKVFGVTFRTPPEDSTGVPHIMEHAVLAGSEKYPVKEPFIELVKGSLATFINAMTFSDMTMYPVASTNLKDFYNLIDVYLDAVFHPLITPEKLLQEGWHYELESLDAPLTYKGIVFNEMKGVYSSPDELIGRYSQQSVFPENSYHHDSGGDPRDIPNLTYEQFRSFYDTYYHPSNARFYFYGDDQPEERLALIDQALQGYQPIDASVSAVPLHPRFDAPRRVIEKYQAGEEDKALITVNWMLTEADDSERTLAFEILEHILIGTPAAPLRKALIDSGLGEDTINAGIDPLRQWVFSVGMKGIQPDDASRVEALILETLSQLATEGIDPATIEASVNTIEFKMREQNTGSVPRGLMVMISTLFNWIHEHDPFEALSFERNLEAIKAKIAQGRYFESLILSYFIDNPHRSTVVLEPEEGVNERLEAAEMAQLQAVRDRLDPDALQQIIEDAARLEALQEAPDSPEDLAKLPMLAISDLDKQIRTIPIRVIDHGGTRVLHHDLFTNGIFYVDVGFDLSGLPQAYLPYLGLFNRALLELGTQTETFVQLSQRIGRKTGGIVPTLFLSQKPKNSGNVAWLFLRGKATLPHVGELLNILRDIITTVRLDDKERFRQIALKMKASRESQLIPAGTQVVNGRLQSGFHVTAWANEQIGGIENLFFLRDLVARIDTDWDSVQAIFEGMRAAILHRGVMLVNATLDAEAWRTVETQVAEFIAAIPARETNTNAWIPTYHRTNEGLTIPAQVNYVGKGANLYELGYQLHGSAYVIPNYVNTTFMWTRIRIQGGAYGGGVNFDPNSGMFFMGSYRDPNLLGTLDNYDEAADFLASIDLDQNELTKAIIGAIGDLDAYQLPDAKGYTSMLRYLLGIENDYRQQIRDEVLGTTAADFRRFGEAIRAVNDQGRIVVLGSPEAIDEANQARGDLLKVIKVL
ncbi:MAG: insulinase family protein [Anaerolineae bacterium]|jgi:hypothetical protein|nr:insulinase family protein [Anaerolineae bacterium]